MSLVNDNFNHNPKSLFNELQQKEGKTNQPEMKSIQRDDLVTTKKYWHSFVIHNGVKMNDGVIDTVKKNSEWLKCIDRTLSIQKSKLTKF